MTEYKPGDIIKLPFESRDRRPKKFFIEKLLELTQKISQRTNSEVEEKFGIKNLLDEDGSISMDNFSFSKGGIYSAEDIETDKKIVDERETEFAKKTKSTS